MKPELTTGVLERLGESHPELRQIVLDEICSYLRLDQRQGTDSGTPDGEPGPDTTQARSAGDEAEVRLIALEILQRHLKFRTRAQRSRYWSHARINLKNAALQDLDLSDCLISEANFQGVQFHGVRASGVRGSTEARASGACSFTGTRAFGVCSSTGPRTSRACSSAGTRASGTCSFTDTRTSETCVPRGRGLRGRAAPRGRGLCRGGRIGG